MTSCTSEQRIQFPVCDLDLAFGVTLQFGKYLSALYVSYYNMFSLLLFLSSSEENSTGLEVIRA